METEVAKLRFSLGDLLYKADRYGEAVIEFEAARKLRPSPNFDYNIARCYERMKDWDAAVAAYERYLAWTPTPLDADAILDHLNELKPVRDAAAGHRARTVAQSPADGRSVAPSRRARIVGGILAGLGVASLAAGVGFGLVGNSTADALTRADRAGGIYDPTLDRNLGTQRVLEGTFLGIGAGAVLAGTATIIVSIVQARRAHRADSAASVALVPTANGIKVQF
jgi:tetratricopeptide (TPR) repeat protein